MGRINTESNICIDISLVDNIQKQNTPADQLLCPKCGFLIGIMPGTPEAICKNCGYKEPCCE